MDARGFACAQAIADRLGRWSRGGASAERMYRTLTDPGYQKATNKHGRRLNKRGGTPMHVMAAFALKQLPGKAGNLTQVCASILAHIPVSLSAALLSCACTPGQCISLIMLMKIELPSLWARHQRMATLTISQGVTQGNHVLPIWARLGELCDSPPKTNSVALQISDVIKDYPAFAKDLDWSARPGTKTYPRWKDALIGCFKVACLSDSTCMHPALRAYKRNPQQRVVHPLQVKQQD